ncbi:hypothetical protein [Rhodoferax sp. GW822-FHT02A01]|uniref:hypothetical protein n=1 Tax=Rhodoferax sp. GW822-FHT02A01 TaxID=3141537 RepID=UPI00315C8C4A
MSKSAAVAAALLEAFFRSVPANRKKRITDGEWAGALHAFHKEAIAIRKQFGLGPLGRALATYQFQKKLLAAGFDAATVRKVVFSLVLNAFVSST